MYLILKSGITVEFDSFERLIEFMANDPNEVVEGYVKIS